MDNIGNDNGFDNDINDNENNDNNNNDDDYNDNYNCNFIFLLMTAYPFRVFNVFYEKMALNNESDAIVVDSIIWKLPQMLSDSVNL